MSLSVLGPAIDVLSGGADLRYPHHAYQIAMAQAVTGVRPHARAIFEVGVVCMDGAKMAKSTGNLVLVSDVLAEHPAAALRLCLLDRPWAQAWDYTTAELDAATARLERLYRAAGRGGPTADAVAGRGRRRDHRRAPRRPRRADGAGDRRGRRRCRGPEPDRDARPQRRLTSDLPGRAPARLAGEPDHPTSGQPGYGQRMRVVVAPDKFKGSATAAEAAAALAAGLRRVGPTWTSPKFRSPTAETGPSRPRFAAGFTPVRTDRRGPGR